MKSMGFSQEQGLGKYNQGITEPIQEEKIPWRLGLGADPNTPKTGEKYFQETFHASVHINQ